MISLSNLYSDVLTFISGVFFCVVCVVFKDCMHHYNKGLVQVCRNVEIILYILNWEVLLEILRIIVQLSFSQKQKIWFPEVILCIISSMKLWGKVTTQRIWNPFPAQRLIQQNKVAVEAGFLSHLWEYYPNASLNRPSFIIFSLKFYTASCFTKPFFIEGIIKEVIMVKWLVWDHTLSPWLSQEQKSRFWVFHPCLLLGPCHLVCPSFKMHTTGNRGHRHLPWWKRRSLECCRSNASQLWT